MLLAFTLEPVNKPLRLSIHYNYQIQGLIYALLEPKYAHFIHNQGYEYGKRNFRMFSFSRLIGSYHFIPNERAIEFVSEVKLYISSPFYDFCRQLVQVIVDRETLNLGQQQVRLISVSTEHPIVNNQNITVKTLSPITVYSTMQKPDGKLYKVYFHPNESDFEYLVENNLKKKYEIIHKSPYIGPAFTIKPVGKTRQNIILYKGGVVKGYSGIFRLTGAPELLQVGLDAGFGTQGSQGFGLCKLI